MAIRPLRSVGGRYLMNIVGVLLWPLGWAVAALITQGILDFMTDPALKYIDPTAAIYSLQATVGVVVVAFWIVFSTISAPLVIQKVLASGSLATGQLLAGAAGGFLQTAATTATDSIVPAQYENGKLVKVEKTDESTSLLGKNNNNSHRRNNSDFVYEKQANHRRSNSAELWARRGHENHNSQDGVSIRDRSPLPLHPFNEFIGSVQQIMAGILVIIFLHRR